MYIYTYTYAHTMVRMLLRKTDNISYTPLCTHINQLSQEKISFFLPKTIITLKYTEKHLKV